METQVSKSNFKAHALEIMRTVEESGDEVVITAHGKPTLVVKRYITKEKSALDKLKGSVLGYEAPTEPVAGDDWDMV